MSRGRLFWIAATGLFLTQAATMAREAVAAPHPFAFEDMVKLAKVTDYQLTPDGKAVLAVSRARPELNRWQTAMHVQSLSAATPAGAVSQQLTFPERGPRQEGQDLQPRLSPDGTKLAFLSTRDGGAPQLYVMSLAGGEARKLTSLVSGVSGLSWTPDGQALIVDSRVYADCPPFPAGEACNRSRSEAQEKNLVKARLIDRLFYRHWDDWFDGKRSHLLRVSLADGGGQSAVPLDLTPGDWDTPPLARGGEQPWAVSPDGKELAYVQNRDKDIASSTNHDVWVVALGKDFVPTGQPRNLTSKNLATDHSPRYSPDGRYLAYLAQRRAGFEADKYELKVYDRTTGQNRSLTESLDATVHEYIWAPDGQRLYFTSSQKGHGAIFVVELSGGVPVELNTGDTHAIELRKTADRTSLFFLRGSLSHPPELCRLDLDAAGRAAAPAVQVSHVNDAVLAEVKLGQSSQLFAKSQDNLTVHSHLVTPPDFSPTKKYPAVVLIHGGPQGAWEDFWQWRWNAQLFAGAGYVVLMPNPRGSDGFGQKFVDGVSGDWGGKPYDDIMRSVDVLVAQPYVDKTKVAALGASYGGYMVNWIAGHTDRFAALVSHAGVYDLRSMYGETEEIWFPRWEFGGDPWNSEQYDKWSPSRYAANFKTPTLVISGERDYRVPVGQGMQFFTTLQQRKVPSRFLIFPDENHWVLKPQNSRLWYGTVLDWLKRYIGGTGVDPKVLETAGTYAR